jgi:hypothetical protein
VVSGKVEKRFDQDDQDKLIMEDMKSRFDELIICGVMKRAENSGKAIGEGPDKPKKSKRDDDIKRLHKALIEVAKTTDEKIRLIWQELHDLRYGKQIEGDAGELEKRLKIK